MRDASLFQKLIILAAAIMIGGNLVAESAVFPAAPLAGVAACGR